MNIPRLYAVDVSVWPRCDAECSPEECGFYYHPSRHSAGEPIVAGWAYRFIARLNFIRESWTAPVVDVSRLHPDREVNALATEQVTKLCLVDPRWRAAPPSLCSSSTPGMIW